MHDFEAPSRTPVLTAAERLFVAEARRGVLATIDPEGRPRLVPICFVVGDEPDRLERPVLYSPIDEKPKTTKDPRSLARVKDLLVLPDVTILVDRWSERWSELAWVRLYGSGQLMEPTGRTADEHRRALEGLRAKYPQYAGQRLEERPILRMAISRSRSWGALSAE